MRQFLTIACISFLLSSCSQRSKEDLTLSDLVPENSAIILKTTSLETLESDIKNSDLINILASKNLLDSIKYKFNRLKNLGLKDEAIICISDDYDLSIISTKHEDFVDKDSVPADSVNYFKTTINNLAVASTSKAIIDEISSQKIRPNPYFKKLLNSSNVDSSVSMHVNAEIATKLLDSIYNQGSVKLNNIANWISLDINLEQNQIIINGFATVADTLPKLIHVFKNTIPQENRTAEITPIDSDSFLSLTFDDFNIINQNLKSYNSSFDKDSSQPSLFENIKEIGIVTRNESKAVALYSTDILETKDALLAEQSISNTFREINIYDFSDKDLFRSVLNPFVNFEIDKYLILNETVIFSNSEDFLINIISSYQSKMTLMNSDIFKGNMSYLSDESSLLFVGNNKSLKSGLAKNISEKHKEKINGLNLKNYEFSAIQFVNDISITHVNGIIQKSQSKANKGSVTQQFNTVLDNDILNSPQIIKNHRNSQKEVIVQDVKNNLYLISNRGKVLWKKRLNGPVLGEVKQIDIYKNGRLQLAFATPKRVYVLDRNGKEVNPFPMKFNDEITQPLSVFDYDNKKNYRFFVVQGKETLMMNARGKTVKGFTFKKANSKIITQPKHFRVGTKDYIVFASGKKLNILDRTGKTRIQVKRDFNFSNNEIYLYQNYFSFTNIKGQLVQVDQKGRVNYKNLLLPRDHDLTTTSKTLVALADNRLQIKSNDIELDFGNYTEPKIYYLRDKIYVAITDLQSQRAYLFDSQTKLIPNFPVYGNSTLVLDNLDQDRELEFVAKGEDNSVILYQIN